MNNQLVLIHHGIKGQRWGVRRYQNSDGSYTKAGLARYGKASDDLQAAREKTASAKEAYKSGTGTKGAYKDAVSKEKGAKKAEANAYKHLKRDSMADKGKRLYQEGKTITDNNKILGVTSTVLSVGGLIGAGVLKKYASTKVSNIGSAAIAAGTLATSSILAGVKWSENKKLRAYYSHSPY